MIPLRQLVFGALGLSALSLCVAIVVSLREAPTGQSALEERSSAARLARVEERLAALVERTEARDRARGTERPRGAPGPADAVEGGEAVALIARLDDLEESVDELEESLAGVVARTDAMAAAVQGGVAGEQAPTAEQIEDLRELALDEAAEPRPRLLAVRQLARVDGGRTVEIARAMKKLFHASDEEWVRSGAVALLQGMVEQELEPWLLETLVNDRFSSSREAATEVLSHYIGSPGVRDALRVAAEHDVNHDVRAEAQNALDKLDEREANR